jgi:predicted  nucleic acid-binding Zn-ribbon protein
MSSSSHTLLKSLQELDQRIADIRTKVEEYDILLAEVAEPVEALVKETEALKTRLKEMRADERRLEGAADDKRARLKRLQDRLNTIRNLREEAALRVETDLVRRALETDEQEALSLLDGIRRAEDQLEALEARRAEAEAELEPRRLELTREQGTSRKELSSMESTRDSQAGELGDRERRLYESYRAGGRRIIVASLTMDGACGACYSMVPLQLQSEVRRGGGLIRCEACGVVLAPPEAVESEVGKGGAAG